MISYDVFLSYRHDDADRAYVRQLAQVLRECALNVWLDEDCLQPGISWVRLLESGIASSRTGLILVGSTGIGPWQQQEIEALLIGAVRSARSVIPVLLQSAPAIVKLPSFLMTRTWVDIRKGYTAEVLGQLLWGITGQRPTSVVLPRAAAPSSMRDYIARRGHCIHKLKAKDASGQWAYYFLLVEPDLEVAFLHALTEDGIIDLEHYGRVVASCYGEKPSEEIRAYLKDGYNFDV
jgi:hypothetical protein